MVGFIKEKMPPVTLKEIYVVDADTLTRERPVGVSGLCAVRIVRIFGDVH